MSKERDAQIDTLTGSESGVQASGTMAQRLLANDFKVESLRTQDVLRNREWIQYDTAVIEVARQRLTAVNDLVQAGLTYPLANALGVTRVEWETVSDLTDAQVSMSGISKSSNDRLDVNLTSVPVPLVHKDFFINARALAAYRNGAGTPLDMTQAQLASRIVSEKIEAILFNGFTVGVSGSPIYGYTTAPNRITGSVTASWVTATGAQALADVLAALGAAAAKNMYGPFMIYCSVASFINLGNDFKANGDLTILQRLLECPGIMGIKPTSNITTGAFVMVQMTSDVVDIIDGIQPTVVSWESQGGFLMNFKVLAIMVPRMKSTYSLQSGIVHYS